MVESDCGFWGDSRKNMLRSNFSIILHDPECESNCCSKSLNQSIQIQPSYYNDLGSLLNASSCNSMETFVSPNFSYENQFFIYNTNFNVNQEAHVKAEDEKLVDSIETAEKIQCHHFCNGASERQKSREVLKRKRKRTIFTTEQIVVMEGVFKKRPYVTKEERLFLTQRLNLNEKAIKIWFQNRRRVTEKQEKERSDSCTSDSTIEEMCDAHTARLDNIEAQINQTIDERGFVTLDNKAFAELVHIIDSVLSKNIDSDNFVRNNNDDISPNENYLMYEPISPESLPDEYRQGEDISKWTPSKPEESLQRIIDIHALLFS